MLTLRSIFSSFEKVYRKNHKQLIIYNIKQDLLDTPGNYILMYLFDLVNVKILVQKVD